MKETALMLRVNPVDPTRPVVTPFRNGVIYVYLHDLWYARRKRQFLQFLRDTHPDAKKHGDRRMNGGTFNAIHHSYLMFEAEQTHFYYWFGLRPPKVRSAGGEHWDHDRSSQSGLMARGQSPTVMTDGTRNIIEAFSS